MNHDSHVRTGRRWARSFHLAVALVAILGMLPLTAPAASAQETTTITVASFTGDGTTPLPFVRFQVTDDSTGTVYGPLETPPGSAEVVFTITLDDPDATFTIEEETPPPCGIAPDPLVVGPLEAGGNLDVEFATDFEDDCDLGGLSAYKYSCPDGFDASAEDYESWRDSCTEEVNGATFEFTPDGGQPFQSITGAWGIAGRAPYIGLNPGDYRIAEIDAVGDPVVYCLTYSSPNPAEAPTYESVERKDVQDDGVDVSLDRTRIACDFFYAQETPGNSDDGSDDGLGDDGGDDGDDGGAAGTETGSIELHKALCPPGYEPNNDIFEDCHGNGVAGVEFTVDGPDGYLETGETVIENDPGPGIVRFTDLAEGTYSIVEDETGDGVSIYVYCSLAEADDQVAFTYSDAGGIDLPLGEGVDVICDWYNIPDAPVEEFGTIRVTKYTCEAGYDGDAANYGDFLDDCPDTTQGVTFTLSPDNGADRNRSTNSNGAVRFDELPDDNYFVSEDVPGEFSTAYAFCTVNDGDPFQADLSSGGAYFLLDEGGLFVDCDWFNVPEDLRADASVTITKYLCPAGQTTAYGDNCDEVLEDVTFTAEGPDGYEASDATNGAGRVAFEGLVAGDYVITETPPDDPFIAVYVVWCTQNGNAYDFAYDDSTGLRINLDLGAGDQVRCDWYNVPPAPPKPAAKGSITIYKFLCLGNEDNDYDWENDCDVYVDGADFDLLASSGGATLASGTTNGDGELAFTALADGAYGLDETSGDWCHAEADIVDASGNVVVQNGGNTDVFIYNCTKKQVSRLPSTGVGTLASSGAGGAATVLAGGAGLLLLLALWRPRVALAVARR